MRAHFGLPSVKSGMSDKRRVAVIVILTIYNSRARCGEKGPDYR